MKKATREQTKRHNTRLVLKTIYETGNISRADIARTTHLTRPTVSNIVAELITRNLVAEIGQGVSVGGKPPTLLEVHYNARHLLCIDLGSKVFRGALVNLKGDITVAVDTPTNGQKGEAALQLVYDLVEELWATATMPIMGIAIGTPGLIDPNKGMIRDAVNLGWKNLSIRDLLTTRYQRPVYILNDSHASALAEYTFGDVHGVRNLIVLKIGRGIGAGIILQNQPYYGDGSGAGEVGHVVVAEDGLLCHCGNYGCLETIVSTQAILLKAERLAQEYPASLLAQGDLTWDHICRAFEANDEAAQSLIMCVGKYLGVAIANLIAGFNVHHLIIAGRLACFGDDLLQAVRQEALRRVLPSMVEQTEITYSTLGTNSVILGSSAMILKHELGIV